jgi:hypothetical protein
MKRGVGLPTAGREGLGLIAARKIFAFKFSFNVSFRIGFGGRSMFVKVKLLIVVELPPIRDLAVRTDQRFSYGVINELHRADVLAFNENPSLVPHITCRFRCFLIQPHLDTRD